MVHGFMLAPNDLLNYIWLWIHFQLCSVNLYQIDEIAICILYVFSTIDDHIFWINLCMYVHEHLLINTVKIKALKYVFNHSEGHERK